MARKHQNNGPNKQKTDTQHKSKNRRTRAIINSVFRWLWVISACLPRELLGQHHPQMARSRLSRACPVPMATMPSLRLNVSCAGCTFSLETFGGQLAVPLL